MLLGEMIEAAQSARSLVAGRSVDELESDRVRRDALLWNFTVLGEASAQLPSDFKAAHDVINWARPSQLRNRIVHGYWSVDLEILHATATDDLPGFIVDLETLLGTLPGVQDPVDSPRIPHSDEPTGD